MRKLWLCTKVYGELNDEALHNRHACRNSLRYTRRPSRLYPVPLTKTTRGESMNVSLLATRLAGNSKLFWKKNGATVLTGVGVAGIPVAMFLTGVATAKTIEAMPKIKVAIQQTEASAWESNKSGGERDAKHERAVKKAVATMQVKMGLQ